MIFIQLLFNNFTFMGVLLLLTCSIMLIYQTTNTLNFTQAIIAIFNSYIINYLIIHLNLNIWVSISIGIILNFLIGFSLYYFLISKIYGNAKIIALIACITIITILIPQIFGTSPYNFPRFFNGYIQFYNNYFTISINSLFILITAIILIIIIILVLYTTKLGIAIRAISSNVEMARLMGINDQKIIALIWGISCVCGGLAAIFQASTNQLLTISTLNNIQSYALLALIICNIKTLYGPLCGAISIPIIYSFFTLINGIWASALLYLFIILLILIKPKGVLYFNDYKR